MELGQKAGGVTVRVDLRALSGHHRAVGDIRSGTTVHGAPGSHRRGRTPGSGMFGGGKLPERGQRGVGTSAGLGTGHGQQSTRTTGTRGGDPPWNAAVCPGRAILGGTVHVRTHTAWKGTVIQRYDPTDSRRPVGTCRHPSRGGERPVDPPCGRGSCCYGGGTAQRPQQVVGPDSLDRAGGSHPCRLVLTGRSDRAPRPGDPGDGAGGAIFR